MIDNYKKSHSLRIKDRNPRESKELETDIKQDLSVNLNTVQIESKGKISFLSSDNGYIKTENDEKKIRKDFKGNQITKGKGKKHHITFKDHITRSHIAEFINIGKVIEDDQSSEKKQKIHKIEKDESVSCTCLIF